MLLGRNPYRTLLRGAVRTNTTDTLLMSELQVQLSDVRALVSPWMNIFCILNTSCITPLDLKDITLQNECWILLESLLNHFEITFSTRERRRALKASGSRLDAAQLSQ